MALHRPQVPVCFLRLQSFNLTIPDFISDELQLLSRVEMISPTMVVTVAFFNSGRTCLSARMWKLQPGITPVTRSLKVIWLQIATLRIHSLTTSKPRFPSPNVFCRSVAEFQWLLRVFCSVEKKVTFKALSNYHVYTGRELREPVRRWYCKAECHLQINRTWGMPFRMCGSWIMNNTCRDVMQTSTTQSSTVAQMPNNDRASSSNFLWSSVSNAKLMSNDNRTEGAQSRLRKVGWWLPTS